MPSPQSDEVLFKDGDREGRINVQALWEHFLAEGLISRAQAQTIVRRSRPLFEAEPALLQVEAPVTLVGDIHGQLYDMRSIFEHGGEWGKATYVFLGDYVDRGQFSCEVLLMLLALKVTYPTKVYMLRGNHESRKTTRWMGFRKECIAKYSEKLWRSSMNTFDVLPLAAVVKMRKHKLLAVHGGIGPGLNTLKDIAEIERVVEVEKNDHVRDLLWADPVQQMIVPKPKKLTWNLGKLKKVKSNFAYPKTPGHFEASTRGKRIVTFPLRTLNAFLANNDLLTIVRAHQQKDGFEAYADGPKYRFPSCFTLFSAPNYVDKSKNLGGIMRVTPTEISIHEFAWRLHPLYKPTFEKDMDLENFHQFVAYKAPSALINLTEKQLEAAFHNQYLRDHEHHKRDLWRLISMHLRHLPELQQEGKRVSKKELEARSARETKAMLNWFAAVDNFTKALREEEQYEMFIDGKEEDSSGDFDVHKRRDDLDEDSESESDSDTAFLTEGYGSRYGHDVDNSSDWDEDADSDDDDSDEDDYDDDYGSYSYSSGSDSSGSGSGSYSSS